MDVTPRGVKEDEEMDESLILIHQNIRGLLSKINEFANMLALEHINPQVICFSEHHMLESNLNSLNISNYNLSTGFCRQTYKKGGVCIYVWEDICYRSLDLTRYCEEKNHEVCAIQIRFMNNPQIIICMYRSSGNFYQFLKLLDIMLSLYHPKTEFIICGDINIDYLSDSFRKQQLSQLLGSYNISHLVNFPTRFQQNHISAIDNIFVNNARL
jgi:exonuclease III